MMTTHYSNACPLLLTHSSRRYTEPLNKVKCTEGDRKSQRAKNITDISLVPLLHTTGTRACPYTWVNMSQRLSRPAAKKKKNTEKACFLWLALLGKRTGRQEIKRKLAYLGSSHQEIIHWPGKGDSLFTQGSSVSSTNSSANISH